MARQSQSRSWHEMLSRIWMPLLELFVLFVLFVLPFPGCASTVVVDTDLVGDHVDAVDQEDQIVDVVDPVLGSSCELVALRGTEVLCVGEESWVLRLVEGQSPIYREIPTRGLSARHAKAAHLSQISRTDVLFPRDGALAQYSLGFGSPELFLFDWSLPADEVGAVWVDLESALWVLAARETGYFLVSLSSSGASQPQEVAWIPSAASGVGLSGLPDSEEKTIWAVTTEEILVGDVSAVREKVPIPAGTYVTSVWTDRGPVVLLRVNDELHFMTRLVPGVWTHIALGDRGQDDDDELLLGCTLSGGVSLAALGETVLMAVECETGVAILGVAPHLFGVRIFAVEEIAGSTRELSFGSASDGGAQVLLDVHESRSFVAERGEGTLRIHTIDTENLNGPGLAFPFRRIDVQPEILAHAVAEVSPQDESIDETPSKVAAALDTTRHEEICPPDHIRCGSQCVNTARNPQHCGRCDQVCLSGRCSASKCAIPCYRSSDCAPQANKASGGGSVSGTSLICIQEIQSGANPGYGGCSGVNRTVNSCSSCSLDETCAQAQNGQRCCIAESCRRSRDCRDPRSKCIAPDNGQERRCVKAGYCGLIERRPVSRPSRPVPRCVVAIGEIGFLTRPALSFIRIFAIRDTTNARANIG